MTILKRIFFPFSEMDAIIPKSGVIIDLGCAEGIFTRYLALASPGRICYGIDLDGIRMRFGADQRFPAQIKLIQGDVLTAQFPSCTGVVAADFLHHIPYKQQELVLKKTYRALTSGGIFLLKDVDKQGGIRHLLSRFWDFVFYPNDTIYYRSIPEWKKALEKEGFSVRVKKTAFWSPFSTVLYTAQK